MPLRRTNPRRSSPAVGCDAKAIARMGRNIIDHPEATDYWLDRLFDALTRATEQDAAAWGFNPLGWMATERAALARNVTRQGPPGIRA